MMKNLYTIFLFILFGTISIAQPVNDNPCTATPLVGNTTCSFSIFDNTNATTPTGIPNPGCGGDSPGAEDIWFTVTVPASGNIIIDTDPGFLTNIAMAIYAAPSCTGPFTLVTCDESSSGGNMPQITLTNQTPGTVFYVRVWDFFAMGFFGIGANPREQGTFSICFIAPPPPPFNDDPCRAITLVPGSTCVYQTANNIDALTTAGVPGPGCGGTNPGIEDVWFVLQVPSSGSVIIDSDDGSLNNMAMAAYTAPSCSGPFSLIACDDNSSGNGNMPRLSLTNQTPGAYIFIRMWDEFSAGFLGIGADPRTQGSFSVCATVAPPQIGGGNAAVGSYTCGSTPAAGNTCATATPICTFDGYCGSTSGYTADYWFSGGNGLGGTLNANGIFCGSIENNSFISFVAGATAVQLSVEVSGGSSCDDGVQFMLFGEPSGGVACGSNTIVDYGCESPMAPGTNTFNATGLIPGQQYYLMVDGFAGDVCNYQINAISGVLVEMSAGPDRTICLGQTTDLTIYGAGTGTISWTGPFLNSTAGQTVSATPTAVGTYQYIVTAPTISPLCTGTATDMDTVLLTVVNGPNVTINAGACINNAVQLTASGASNYTWSPPYNINTTSGAIVSVSPGVPTTYTVNGTTASGCLVSQSVLVPACAILLSTELKSFSGHCDGHISTLNWRTENEYDLSHYELYSSTDGILWNLVSTKDAKNESEATAYSMIDQNPPANISYYKLIEVGYDGSQNDLQVIVVSCDYIEKSNLTHYIDGSEILHLSLQAPEIGSAALIISDISGRVLLRVNQLVEQGANQYAIDLNQLNLPQGVYILSLVNENFGYHEKIIVR